MSKTIENSIRPVCPYCGSQYDNFHRLEMEDLDLRIVNCKNCNSKYEIFCEMEFRYTTTIIDKELL